MILVTQMYTEYCSQRSPPWWLFWGRANFRLPTSVLW